MDDRVSGRIGSGRSPAARASVAGTSSTASITRVRLNTDPALSQSEGMYHQGHVVAWIMVHLDVQTVPVEMPGEGPQGTQVGQGIGKTTLEPQLQPMRIHVA